MQNSYIIQQKKLIRQIKNNLTRNLNRPSAVEIQRDYENDDRIGVPDNKKYFSDSIFFGNITVCRFTHKPGQLFLDKIKELGDIVLGQLKISEVKLVVCNAICNPKTRRIVATYHLGEKNKI